MPGAGWRPCPAGPHVASWLTPGQWAGRGLPRSAAQVGQARRAGVLDGYVGDDRVWRVSCCQVAAWLEGEERSRLARGVGAGPVLNDAQVADALARGRAARRAAY